MTEGEVLFHCLGIGKIDAISGEQLLSADWDRIVRLADGHKVAPLLYYRLRTSGKGAHIPPEVMKELRTLHLSNAWINMRMYNGLSKVLSALHNEGIPVIVLKGAALAELVYRSIALRPMEDVDLLAKGEDMARIGEVLSKLGYALDLSAVLSRRHVQWSHHVVYINGSSCFEIHPKMKELPGFDPWANAHPARIASSDAFVLGSEDFLLHICLHLDYHFYRGTSSLIWWCDIAEFLRRYQKELDWSYIMQVVKEYNVEGAIGRILRAVNEWNEGCVPADVLDQISGDDTTITINDMLYIDEQKRKRMLVEGTSLSAISRIPFLHNKLYHLLRIVFPNKWYIRRLYRATKPGRVWLYYFVRIGDLAVKSVKALYLLPGYLKDRH